jgi:hypothetical protein
MTTRYSEMCYGVCCWVLGGWLIWSGTGLGQAETHEMLHVSGATAWSGTVTVTGGQLTAFKADFQTDELDWARPLALYVIKQSATVTLNLAYSGAAPLVEGSVTVNGQPGSTYVKNISLARNETERTGSDLIVVRATALVENEQGEVFFQDMESVFLMETRLYKQLAVEMNNTSGAFERTLRSLRITPLIGLQAGTPYASIYLDKNFWGDAGVQVEPLGVIAVTPAEWQRTDEFGYATVRLTAPTDAGFEGGFCSDLFRLRAVKEGCELELEKGNFISYAIVHNARNVWFLGPSGALGDLAEPVLPPMVFQPGDAVQIGTRLVSGELEVEFCNGQKATLEASSYEGFRATVGAGDLIAGRPLLWLDLRGMAQDLQDNPRRCLRLAIYKGFGNALDTVTGVPDPVGWVTETPGAKLEKWLANWGEQAYQPPRSPRPGPPVAAGAGEDPALRTVAHAAFEFYTDGTIWVENAGAPLALDAESGVGCRLPLGAATLIQTNAYRDQVPTSPGTSTTAWTAPAGGDWTLQPGPGQVVTNATPLLSISNAAPLNWVKETTTIRLDGRDVTAWLPLAGWPGDERALFSTTFDEYQSLSNGNHTLTVTATTRRGDLLQASSTFTILAPVAAPADAQTLAYAGGVWVSWETIPGATGYRVWRADATNAAPVLLTDPPRHQPGFLDVAPLPQNVYWIETLAGASGSGRQHPVQCAWAPTLPDAPSGAGANSNHMALEAISQGVRLTFDASAAHNTRWRWARGGSAAGPFTPLATAEETVAGDFLDTTVAPGGIYYYELTPLRVDGTPGPAVVAGPIEFAAPPTPPAGLSAHVAGNEVRLAWNPYADGRAESLRLYCDTGAGFALVQQLSPTATEITWPGGGTNVSRYYLTAAGAGTESEPSVAVGAGRLPRPSTAARVFLSTPELEVPEAAGMAVIPVTRSDNLGEASVVHFVAEAHSLAGAGTDFTPLAGSLVFAPGQTTGQIQVPILADAVSEWTEPFRVRLTGALGATTLEGGSTLVNITESDILLFANYQTEQTVNEPAGQALITVERVLASQRAVTVTVTVAADSGTAQPGVDYIAPTNWVLQFAPGQTRQSLALPLLDNPRKDGWRTLRLELTQPTGGACLSESFAQMELRIRDDETHPGQIRPDLGNASWVLAPAGADQITVPLTRANGSDGPLSAFIMAEGGPLPWGAITVSPQTLNLAEGETNAMLTIHLNRSAVPAEVAPYTVITVINTEYPHETVPVVVIFAPENTAPDFATWAASRGLSGVNAGSTDDPDGDRATNLEELALGSGPRSVVSRPSLAGTENFGQLTLYPVIHSAARLVVLAEFSADLAFAQPRPVAGYWEWDAGQQAYQVQFAHWQEAAPGLFGRLRYLWLTD